MSTPEKVDYRSPVVDEALEVLSLSGMSSRQCILATFSRKPCCEAPLKRADSHTQQLIESTKTRRRNIAHRLGAGPFLHTLLGQQKSMASGGTRPAVLSFSILTLDIIADRKRATD